MPKRYSRRARALDPSDRPQPEQRSRLRAWAAERCPKLDPKEFDHELELWLEHHVARGTLIRDVEASCREWLLRGERHRRTRAGARVPGVSPHAQKDPRTVEQERMEAEARRQVAAEDPEERRRAIEEARNRPWRQSRVLRPPELNGDDDEGR